MKARIVKLLKLIIPIGIGVYLTWYFLSGLSDKDIQQTKDAFLEANYFWVILGMLVALSSHISRAYRWLILLDPMGYKPKFSNSYHAVMSGYIINFTVPRSGEFARAGLLAGAENVPFEKGFGTIVVERMIDLIMFGIVFVISGVLQTNADEINAITQGTEGGFAGMLPYLVVGAVIFGGIGLGLYLKVEKFRKFVLEKVLGFWEGLKTIWTMQRKWTYILHTIYIWVAYVGGIWVFAQAFPETAQMSIGCVFAAFVVGAAAIAVLPGGIGAYPAWITAVLSIYGIEFAAYGIFVWVAQTLLLLVLGLVSLFLIQRNTKIAQS